MRRSRTQNVSINTIVGLVCQLINLCLNFIVRTSFIKILGAEYLGVNGLFTNILTILSFAELGIGNAIIFSMYKPLMIQDEKKLASLMLLYKKAYTIIGSIIAVAGLCVIPFLKFLIKDVPDISEKISLLYLLFLLNTVLSYFFVYKKNILIADQKSYVTMLINQVVMILKTILQVVFLVATHKYILFLLIQIVCTLIENIICSIVADKQYPFLKDTAEPLNSYEIKKIYTDVKALSLYKFGSVILNGTDNILVTILSGVRDVGLASNYLLLTTSCNSILSKVTDAFTASVGNLNAVENCEKQYDVFKKLFFITAWMYGYVAAGLAITVQPFITSWIGNKYLFPFSILLAIIIEFYVKGVHFAAYTYRCTLGYFVQGKWAAIFAAIINIILSIALFNCVGLVGIFIATPIARLITTGIVDPILIYKYTFNRNVLEYYGMYIKYTGIFILITLVCNFVCSFLVLASGWSGVIAKIMIVTCVFNGLMVLVFGWTKMFREIVDMVIGVFKRKRGNGYVFEDNR